jgi:5-methylcytosine-specific restriction endonuclease McrA
MDDHSDRLTCLNCDDPIPGRNPARLYCGPLCRDTARTVRYVRAVKADGRIKEPDVAEAVKIRIAMVLGGGYPAEERKLTSAERQAIFERDGGRCRSCGAPATEVDHIGAPVGGDINHPDNLQALCSKCHRKKTMEGFRPIETAAERARAAELRRRIESPEPVRVCDSADWNDRWRGIAAERKRRVLNKGNRDPAAAR